MTNRNGNWRAHKGFTLVEILIVVVILGILAAIVIPQFTNASQEASASSLNSQLQTIRSQIELFRVKNNGALPLLVTGAGGPWTDFTEAVDDNGDPAPYLQDEPVNPFTGQSGIIAGGGFNEGDAATDGWVYDEATGEIWAVGFDEDTDEYTAP